MIIKLIKPRYYTDKVNAYYVITAYLSSHPDMFPSERAEIEIVDKKTIAELSIVDDRGELMGWGSFNAFFPEKFKALIRPASTIAVKIPDFIVEHPDNLYIADDYYAYYENRVFRCHLELKDIDFKSFEIIDSIYSKDKNKVFYLGGKIVEASASDFMAIDRFYSKDDRHVYFKGEVLNNANPEKFKKLGYHYHKDNNFVWGIDGFLINADAETLKALRVLFTARDFIREEDSCYAVDKNNVYYKGGNILTSANPETFKVVAGSTFIYGMDENGVYRGGEIIQGADSKTFKIVEKRKKNLKYDAYDKNHKYYNGIKVRN